MAKLDENLAANLGLEDELDQVLADVMPQRDALDEESGVISAEYGEVSDLCKRDLDFFAGFMLPEVYKFPFPRFYHELWHWIISESEIPRNNPQLGLGLPRGFAKTMFLKLLICYLIIFSKKRFILVISENTDKAKGIVADVSDMLSTDNCRVVFGDWKVAIETDTQEKKKFTFRGRAIVFKGAGASTGIRGITEKNTRPDFMAFDDVQSREESESEVSSNNLENWMYTTAMKAKSPFGCTFLFIANMYPTKGSLLRKIKKNPEWKKIIVGGILANGESLWPALHPIANLLKEYRNDLAAGHPEAFFAEVLNDENATTNNLINLQAIPKYPFEDDDISQGDFLIIDPATDKPGADAVSIGHFNIYDGKPYLQHLIEGRFSPSDTIKEAFLMCARHNVQVICVESNSYQYTLLHWFEVVAKQLGMQGFHFLEIQSNHMAKVTKIVNMFKLLLSGDVGVHPRCRPPIDNQIIQFNPLRKDNIDGLLDLLTHAPKCIELYGPLICSLTTLELQEFDSLEVSEYNSPF